MEKLTVYFQAWTMLEAITGMSFEGWKTECPENALVLHHGLHYLFGEFQLYLELNDDVCPYFVFLFYLFHPKIV